MFIVEYFEGGKVRIKQQSLTTGAINCICSLICSPILDMLILAIDPASDMLI